MRSMVTGAAGFIGSHLVDELLHGGHEVIGVDSFTPYYPRSVKDGYLSYLNGRAGFSFSERCISELTPSDFDGVDVIYHMAAQPGVRLSWQDFDTYLSLNLSETNRLLRAADEAGVRRIVFASSSSVYGDAAEYPTSELTPMVPRSPYGVTKLAGEALLTANSFSSSVEIAMMRFFTVYGPGQRPDMAIHRICEAALGQSDFRFKLFGDGEQRRDFTYVGDVVRACMLAAEKELPEQVVAFNVGGSGDVSMNELIQLIEAEVGASLSVDRLPAQKGDVFRTGADARRALEVLGWAASTRINDGLRKQIQYLALPTYDAWTTAPESGR